MLIGYKDENDEYHGFLGSVKKEEYRLLNRLSKNCTSPDILSIDELKGLSDIKDLLARAQIRLYESEKELSEDKKQKLDTVKKALGEALESFDVYRKDAAQLDILLSFCVVDAQYSELNEKSGEYESKNFQDVDTSEEDVPLLYESIEADYVKHIAISEDFVGVISDWIMLDGGRILNEAVISEDDEEALESEIEWWSDNIDVFEDATSFNLTTMLFRALRNNVLKSERTGELVLSHKDWSERIEVL